MVEAMIVSVRSMSKGWAFRLLLAALLVPMFLASPVHVTNAATRVQPVLLSMAAQQPNAVVGVIVQKMVQDNSVEQMVARLGGTVTKDLHIINAFAANMPAKAVPELAKSAGVRWVSLDAPVVKTGGNTCSACISTTTLQNAYVRAIGADRLWNESPGYLQGQSIGVAVIDSGVSSVNDFKVTQTTRSAPSRVVANQRFGNFNAGSQDLYGHGTHVAGIIGGNGANSSGTYIGVAPKVNLIALKATDDQGGGTTSAVVDALQWALNNKGAYNIKVVNLSLNSTVMESYHTNPLDAASEILWFNGIVVVTSAGNTAGGALYPPANDPFVITVGATDDRGTASTADDTMASFSAYGTTSDGFAKPDLVAPGTNIVSTRSSAINMVLATQHPANVVNQYYFRMSGTSMAAPMVAGAAALLLQDEPNLTPDQVKYRLKATSRPFDTPLRAGAGYLDVYAAVHGTTSTSANTGTVASQLLWTGSQPITWGSVNWNSVNWNSVNWNSVNWNSVNWNSVNWNSDYWGQ